MQVSGCWGSAGRRSVHRQYDVSREPVLRKYLMKVYPAPWNSIRQYVITMESRESKLRQDLLESGNVVSTDKEAPKTPQSHSPTRIFLQQMVSSKYPTYSGESKLSSAEWFQAKAESYDTLGRKEPCYVSINGEIPKSGFVRRASTFSRRGTNAINDSPYSKS